MFSWIKKKMFGAPVQEQIAQSEPTPGIAVRKWVTNLSN